MPILKKSDRMRSRVHRPSPALVIALVALFVSVGGVGYAAATIGSAQIKNNSVRSKDIRNNDVRGSDVRTGTLEGSDLKDNGLTGTDVVESTLGTVPSANSAGTAGSAGSAGFAQSATKAGNADALGGIPAGSYPRGVEIVTNDGNAVTPDPAKYDVAAATALCPAGKKVIGGGGSTQLVESSLDVLNAAIRSSNPDSSGTAWQVSAVESGDVDEEVKPWRTRAYAICATR